MILNIVKEPYDLLMTCTVIEGDGEVIDESPKSSEDVLGETFWLANLQEGEVDIEHFPHQRVITVAGK